MEGEGKVNRGEGTRVGDHALRQGQDKAERKGGVAKLVLVVGKTTVEDGRL